MSAQGSTGDLIQVVTLLGAAVVAVPIFRRLGLGSVLGYLAAGLAIGPFGIGLFDDPQSILHTAELGVVMFLFVIGLEMRPSHLWSLRREIFGLGSLQVVVCGALLTCVGIAFGFPLGVSFVSAMGFVLTSTAIVMQLLSERGDVAAPRGQRIVAILLFEDLLIVPLLAIIAFMAPVDAAQQAAQHTVASSRWASVGIGAAAVAALVAAGIWLLNPMFRVLANAKAREVMTAAALLVVLGAALLMQLGGLSMAMGAFLAGVLLSESAFRHQLEADIEPFRGLLLGLFFLGVGMSLDLAVVGRNWPIIVAGVLAMMVVKFLCIYGVARLAKSSHADALDRAVLMAQGGEFAFVLFTTASGLSLFSGATTSLLIAIVTLSMALTPLFAALSKRLLTKAPVETLEEDFAGAGSDVLMIGFSRFGQIAAQTLLASGHDLTIIDHSADRIRQASSFGFRIYFGDGTRRDVLQSAGIGRAKIIAVCTQHRDITDRIVDMVHAEFPQARVFARSYDRGHTLSLRSRGVDYELRETLESGLLFGRRTLEALGLSEEDARRIGDDIRKRDEERLVIQATEGIAAGLHMLHTRPVVRPEPLIKPKRTGLAEDGASEFDDVQTTAQAAS